MKNLYLLSNPIKKHNYILVNKNRWKDGYNENTRCLNLCLEIQKGRTKILTSKW